MPLESPLRWSCYCSSCRNHTCTPVCWGHHWNLAAHATCKHVWLLRNSLHHGLPPTPLRDLPALCLHPGKQQATVFHGDGVTFGQEGCHLKIRASLNSHKSHDEASLQPNMFRWNRLCPYSNFIWGWFGFCFETLKQFLIIGMTFPD